MLIILVAKGRMSFTIGSWSSQQVMRYYRKLVITTGHALLYEVGHLNRSCVTIGSWSSQQVRRYYRKLVI